MIRRLITLLIVGALVLFGLAVLWPTKAELVAGNILKGFSAIENTRLPLPGYKEPTLRIVDPEAISSVITEETSNLASIFRAKRIQSEELTVEDIIDETNKRRIAEGLPPLKANALLTASAKLKTDDMIAFEYFEHESPTGVTVSDLGKKVGYNYVVMGENLALGNFIDAADLLDAWMESPGHRANILNDLYQEIGVYAAKGTYEGREVWFAVQHFGVDRNACPSVSTSLKSGIDALNADLAARQREIETLKEVIEEMNSNEEGYDAKVEYFNKLVNSYNDMLSISKQRIREYNAQVAKFNACIGKYQK